MQSKGFAVRNSGVSTVPGQPSAREIHRRCPLCPRLAAHKSQSIPGGLRGVRPGTVELPAIRWREWDTAWPAGSDEIIRTVWDEFGVARRRTPQLARADLFQRGGLSNRTFGGTFKPFI